MTIRTRFRAPAGALTGVRLTPVFQAVRPAEAAIRWAALLVALTIHGAGFAIADLAYQPARMGIRAPAPLKVTLVGDVASTTTAPIQPAPSPPETASAVSRAPTRIHPSAHVPTQTAAVAAPAAASVPVVAAGIVYNPSPAYPRRARYRGLEGRVVLEVLVATDGHAREVTIRHSSGYTTLDQAAVAGIRHWRFTPASRAGLAIPARIRIPVVFRLR